MPKIRNLWLWAAITAALVVAICGVVALLPETALISQLGWALLFLLGLAWLVFGVEHLARRIEFEQALQSPGDSPQVLVGGETTRGRFRSWNPLDPNAYFYGLSFPIMTFLIFAALSTASGLIVAITMGAKDSYWFKNAPLTGHADILSNVAIVAGFITLMSLAAVVAQSKRLRQSVALLTAYTILFTVAYFLVNLSFGNKAKADEYDLPPGGGTDSPKASSVKVQKIIQKKYVINPYSSIVFAAPPPIDNVDVKLTDETSNRYQVGQGDGGLGSGEGEGGGFGSGKGGGKIRFIRLRHSDKTWDKNFGVGGDRNLLAELLARYPRMVGKVADETEAIDAATLGNFPATKSPPLIYIGAMHTFAPAAADKKVLKQYLTERHGMILGDNLGGSGFHGNFIAAMNEITGVTAVPISRDDPIHKRPFELPQLPIVVAHGGSTALGWKIDGRWAVYYHPGALSDAWRDDHAGIRRDVWDMCYQLGINIISYAHREQDQWRRSQQP